MKQRKAIVTGATGMLALALIRKLIKEDFFVYAIIRPGSKRASNIPLSDNIKTVECDLSEIASLPSKIAEPCEFFFHFAWDATYGDGRNNMPLQIANIKASVDAVEAAKALGARVFLGAGSQAEFGRSDKKLAPESPTNPETGYGIAKLSAGRMTRVLCEKYGIRHVWCRIFSTYGPYDGAQTMVMSGILKMLSGERPLYTKAEQLWDYLYCDDAAEAFYLAALKGKDGAVYCIASGRNYYLKDYIYAIRDAIDPKISVGIGELPYYENQVMYLAADISSLQNDTGFMPKYTFEEGIKATVEWVKSQKGCGK